MYGIGPRGIAAAAVALTLPAGAFHAGRELTATLVNPTRSHLEVGLSPTLERLDGRRWVAITHTHGVDVAVPADEQAAPELSRPGSRTSEPLELYDDLAPGTYRATIPYRSGPARPTEIPHFSAASPRLATRAFRVLAFAPGPAPRLPASRISTIALNAAARAGDGSPTSIRYAEGSRQTANLVATGTLVNAWNWSYLVVVRGSFTTPTISSPPGIPTGPGPVRLTYPVLTLVVNARTGAVTDGGFAKRVPKLARVGPVTALPG